MAKKLKSIEITPSANGGHTVTHHYKEEMHRNSRAHSGVSMYVEPEHHTFGEDEGHEMLAHVANHLKIAEHKPKRHEDEDMDEREDERDEEDDDDADEDEDEEE